MRSLLAVFCLALVFGLSGCGGNSEGEAQMKKSLDIMKEVCESVESGNRDNILAAKKKMEDYAKEPQNASAPPEVIKKFRSDMDTLFNRTMLAVAKAMQAEVLEKKDMDDLRTAITEHAR